MDLFYVRYRESYQGDYDGHQEEGVFGPWDNLKAAEMAEAYLETRKLGRAYNFKPLYDHLEISKGRLMSEFDESVVW